MIEAYGYKQIIINELNIIENDTDNLQLQRSKFFV